MFVKYNHAIYNLSNSCFIYIKKGNVTIERGKRPIDRFSVELRFGNEAHEIIGFNNEYIAQDLINDIFTDIAENIKYFNIDRWLEEDDRADHVLGRFGIYSD